MKSSRFALWGTPLVLAAVGGLVTSCTAEFKAECPEGTAQSGGGDVDKACAPIAGAAGAADEGGAAGTGSTAGGAPVAGSGGGGGMVPIPPGGECNPTATKCTGDAQQLCGDDGTWGAPQPCDIACDEAGSKCVVPAQLAAGSSHACALLSDGTVRCWGRNFFGEVGNGTTSDAFKPQRVVGVLGAKSIVAGQDTSCALFEDNTASCWGGNNSGQLGDGGNQSAVVPKKLPLQNVLAVAIGGNAASSADGNICAIVGESGSGVLKCAGENSHGQNGTGSSSLPIRSFVNALGLPGSIEKVSVGGGYVCAINAAGSVFCWGQTNVAQVGVSASETPVLQPHQVSAVEGAIGISAATAFQGSRDMNTCAVKNDGIVYCWGNNQNGQLGRGTEDESSGPATGRPPGVVIGLGSVKQVDVGGSYACAVKEDGTVWCWGENEAGQLGVPVVQPSTVTRPVQANIESVVEIAAGSSGKITGFVCARTVENKVLCWGDNKSGQLGIGQAIESSSTPTPVAWK
jgi:alpha-tubulin suppressor-like RCC1 family protein